MWAVYKVNKNGKLTYISRSVTQSEKLAKEIANGLTNGEIVMPDGSIKKVKAFPHIAKRIDEES